MKCVFCSESSGNCTVQNTNKILSHKLYAAERPQASQESRGKERMHPGFLASQIDASRAKESFIYLHPSILKLHMDASK